jgi:hypothetical protein
MSMVHVVHMHPETCVIDTLRRSLLSTDLRNYLSTSHRYNTPPHLTEFDIGANDGEWKKLYQYVMEIPCNDRLVVKKILKQKWLK